MTARAVTSIALLSLLAVGGCLTEDERRAQQEAQRIADQQECADLGFEPGAAAFADCMLRLQEIRAQTRRSGGFGVGVGVGIGL